MGRDGGVTLTVGEHARYYFDVILLFVTSDLFTLCTTNSNTHRTLNRELAYELIQNSVAKKFCFRQMKVIQVSTLYTFILLVL